jgi:hypothetical protein
VPIRTWQEMLAPRPIADQWRCNGPTAHTDDECCALAGRERSALLPVLGQQASVNSARFQGCDLRTAAQPRNVAETLKFSHRRADWGNVAVACLGQTTELPLVSRDTSRSVIYFGGRQRPQSNLQNVAAGQAFTRPLPPTADIVRESGWLIEFDIHSSFVRATALYCFCFRAPSQSICLGLHSMSGLSIFRHNTAQEMPAAVMPQAPAQNSRKAQ